MRIATTFGERDGAGEHDLAEAMAHLQRDGTQDDPAFVRVEREGSDEALQLLTLHLERVDDGRVFRASVPPELVERFRRFAAGARDWDAGIEWTEITAALRARRRAAWIYFLVVAAVVGLALLIGWWLIRRAEGRA